MTSVGAGLRVEHFVFLGVAAAWIASQPKEIGARRHALSYRGLMRVRRLKRRR